MTTKAYNSGRLGLGNGSLDWDNDNFYAVLVSAAYTYSAVHTAYSDVSTNEIGDAGYAPVALTGNTVALVDIDDVLYDCNDISFGSNVSIDASGGHLVILKGSSAGPLAGDPVVFAREMVSPSASTNSEFTITTPNGIYRINAV